MVRPATLMKLGVWLFSITTTTVVYAQQNCSRYDGCCVRSEQRRQQCLQPYQNLFESCASILNSDLCSRIIYEPAYEFCEAEHQKRLLSCDQQFPGCKNTAPPKDEFLAQSLAIPNGDLV